MQGEKVALHGAVDKGRSIEDTSIRKPEKTDTAEKTGLEGSVLVCSNVAKRVPNNQDEKQNKHGMTTSYTETSPKEPQQASSTSCYGLKEVVDQVARVDLPTSSKTEQAKPVSDKADLLREPSYNHTDYLIVVV